MFSEALLMPSSIFTAVNSGSDIRPVLCSFLRLPLRNISHIKLSVPLKWDLSPFAFKLNKGLAINNARQMSYCISYGGLSNGVGVL